jgi:hypothetical protein
MQKKNCLTYGDLFYLPKYDCTVVKYVDVAKELSYGKFHYVILGCVLPVTQPLVVSYVYKRRMSEKARGVLRLGRALVITGHLIAS